jgi:hypothetical protein
MWTTGVRWQVHSSPNPDPMQVCGAVRARMAVARPPLSASQVTGGRFAPVPASRRRRACRSPWGAGVTRQRRDSSPLKIAPCLVGLDQCSQGRLQQQVGLEQELAVALVAWLDASTHEVRRHRRRRHEIEVLRRMVTRISGPPARVVADLACDLWLAPFEHLTIAIPQEVDNPCDLGRSDDRRSATEGRQRGTGHAAPM